jgi:5'-AMP-activated protein kinase regulatory gamma subunit
VSAPLWDSKTSTYAGLLTTSDYLNVVQYYWQNPDALAQIDQFKLNSLRDIERALGVTPIETVSIHPLQTLYEACRRMLESRARRIPLVDIDDETQREMVVSVLTQYRILKFVSVNVKETQMLRKPLRDLHVGSYENLSYAHMDSPVIEVIQALVKRSISCVPILDKDGMVLNVFEAVDVIALIKGGDYDNLQLTVGKALEKRSDVSISLQHYHPHITSTLANSYFRRTSPAFTPAPSTTASTPSSTPSANPACTASSSSTSEATSWACSR